MRSGMRYIEKLILLAVFLSPCSEILIFKTGVVDLKILQLLWSAIFLLILIQKAVSKACAPVKNTIDINSRFIFTLYLTVIILSCLFSLDIKMSLKELIQYVYLFLTLLAIYSYSRKREFMDKLINAIILSNALLVGTSIISYFSGRLLIPSFIMYPNGTLFVMDSLYKTQSLVETSGIINRLEGIMGLGTIGIANCVLIHSVFINYKIRKSSGRLRKIYVVLFAANIVTVGLTYSRAALVVFILIHFVSLFGKNKKVNLGIALAGICSIPVILSFFPSLYARLQESFNLGEGSTRYHLIFWIISLREGYDHILTGIGLGNAAYLQGVYVDMAAVLFKSFDLYSVDGANVHNFILQIWAEQGAVGLFANMLLIFYPVMHFIKIKFIKKLTGGKTIYDYIILAYTATLAYNLTNNNFYIETFWVLAALAYACKDIYTQHVYLDERAGLPAEQVKNRNRYSPGTHVQPGIGAVPRSFNTE